MKTISSRENPRYKELKHLASSAQVCRKAGRTLLDGVHLCVAYLQHVGMPVFCVVGESARSHPEVAAVLAQCDISDTDGSGGCVCIALPDALYHALSQVEHGIELLFVIDTPLEEQGGPAPVLKQTAVLLDNLQDPGNLGSILRSAAAASIREVFCSPGTAFAWSPKVLRAGMGAHFLLKIAENVDLLPLVRDAKLPVLATSSHAQQSVYQADLRQPVAWLFGHEGQGVADELLALATYRVAIPHAGAIESLNVAASAAVCFFEQVRQQLK
jgi:TrmH family RNA methyltransferase